MKCLSRVILLVAISFGSGTAWTAERYTEARITQVESGDEQVVVFLQWQSGDSLPPGNGGSNEPGQKYFLYLAKSSTDIAIRRHFIASALAAMSNQSVARFRWEDTGTNAGRVMYMLVRSD
jgi:hypothetical protein